ncbi:unnamed protein product [Nezara viridula]|uniref:Uncharacterized protein n=1 Tax=Nezara viridula TaxID=85310 RepID=A0A9P0H8D4_NEZVI|nr:unnamed protein product [Nezara viridula]
MNGAHTYGFNCGSIGIAFLGNFDVQYLSPEMEEAFHMIIEEGLKLGEIAEDYKLFGHLQLRNGSESPGVHAYDLKNKLCDISYNFVIAGDGYIYEGRGWGKYGDHTYGFDCDSIGIAFLGNYDLQHLTPKMISSFQLLVEEGLEMGEIAQDYKLFGHSQVRESKGPDTPRILNFTEALQTRQQWSKSNSETPCQLSIDRPAKYIVIGHTVTLPCRSRLACETTVTLIQNDHKGRGRCDISYNFVIGDDGYIYEGRGWTKLDVIYSLNYTLKLRTRYNWSQFRTKLQDCDPLTVRPAKFVVVGHTVSGNCETPAECERIMTTIQSYHIRKGFCDIGYNFLIGDDGYIYEGRGWGIYGAHTIGFNCDSVGIGLIGNFNKNIPSSDMFDMLKLLIEEGLRINEISKQYKLLFQSQINEKPSPGGNVEKVLKNWDHWSNVTTEDRQICKKKSIP